MTGLTPLARHRLNGLRRKQAIKNAIRFYGPDVAKAIGFVVFVFCAYAMTNDTPARLVILTQGQLDQIVAEERKDAAKKMMEAIQADAAKPSGPTLSDMFRMPRKKT